jgi:alanyl-tRNA synthetase
MTHRRYYEDSHTTQFEAEIVEYTTLAGHPTLVLDQTYFYPTGGGQPNDLGTINGVEVLDVQTREGDHAVVHLMAGPVETTGASCQIDWARRFDHMQQHTGQHILTQAFVTVAEAQTVAFHLGSESVTIDLDRADLSDTALMDAETLSNQIITQDRPVTATLIDPAQAEGIRMRRMPGELLTDGLRVVEVEGFDRTACGGTHVRRTGEIGLLKVVKTERRGDKTRVEFRCGGRALFDYHAKHVIISALAARFTRGYWEIEDAVEALQREQKETSRALRAARETLIGYDAERLLAGIESPGLIVAAFEERDAGELRTLASLLVERKGVVALLASAGKRVNVIAARHSEGTADMKAVLQTILGRLEEGRGGGRPDFAQGGAGPAELEAVQQALDAAASLLGGTT